MVESLFRRKKSETEAITGRGLTKVLGVITTSDLAKLIFSLIDRSSLTNPILKAVEATSSPTRRTRRLERLSRRQLQGTPRQVEDQPFQQQYLKLRKCRHPAWRLDQDLLHQ